MGIGYPLSTPSEQHQIIHLYTIEKCFNCSFRMGFLFSITKLLLKIDHIPTVLPAKSESDFMFCLQSYHGLSQ